MQAPPGGGALTFIPCPFAFPLANTAINWLHFPSGLAGKAAAVGTPERTAIKTAHFQDDVRAHRF